MRKLAVWSLDAFRRRGGAVFLGVGVILLLNRDGPPSPVRAGLAKGFIVGTLALAFVPSSRNTPQAG
jgi:hypothetical protein